MSTFLRLLSILLFSVALSSAGCRSAGTQGAELGSAGKTARRLRLEDYIAQFAIAIELVGDQVVERSDDPQVARHALLWKMRSIPAARRSLELADDQAAFVALWMYCARMENASRSEVVERLFGDSAQLVIETCQRLEKGAQQLAPSFLTREQTEIATTRIEAFTKANPIGLVDISGDMSATDQVASIIGEVINKPLDFVLRPLGSLNPTSGLSDTALAVERAAVSVDAIRTDIGYLPDMLRWQTTLLLHELDRNPTVTTTVASLAEVSESSARIAGLAEKLPGELRQELSQFLIDLDEHQAGLHVTLDTTREGVAEATVALDKVDEVMRSSDATARSLTTTSEALQGLVREVTHLIETASAPKEAGSEEDGAPATESEEVPAKPFDINEYTRAAEELTESARALTALVEEVVGLTGPEGAEAQRQGQKVVLGLVDGLLLRAGLFAVFLVGLGFAGRVAWKRLGGVAR